MNPEPWVVAAAIVSSWANLAAWTYFATYVVRLKKARREVPQYVVAAAIVATFAASLAGAIASISLLNIVDPWLIRAGVWACWGALFSAGAYATLAAIRAARTARRKGPR